VPEAREAADEAHALAAEAYRAAADGEDAKGRARLEGVGVVGVGEPAVLGVEDGGVVEGRAASRGDEQRRRAAVQRRGGEVRPAREDGVRGGGDERGGAISNAISVQLEHHMRLEAVEHEPPALVRVGVRASRGRLGGQG
jgi:hypothetical protein